MVSQNTYDIEVNGTQTEKRKTEHLIGSEKKIIHSIILLTYQTSIALFETSRLMTFVNSPGQLGWHGLASGFVLARSLRVKTYVSVLNIIC